MNTRYLEPKLGLEVDLIKNPHTGEYVQFEWRDVVGSEGLYQVSNYGHVRSFRRWKILSDPPKDGYSTVVMRMRGGKRIYRKVHRLLMQAFVPNPEEKPIVNHLDGNKTNNVITNLEWCTHSENVLHAYKTGLNSGIGVGHYKSKLTEDMVIDIVSDLSDSSLRLEDIANKYGVTSTQISNINYGVNWSRVTGITTPIRDNRWVVRRPPFENPPVVNCRGEQFITVCKAAATYDIKDISDITESCQTGCTAGFYSDGYHIRWHYIPKNQD